MFLFVCLFVCLFVLQQGCTKGTLTGSLARFRGPYNGHTYGHHRFRRLLLEVLGGTLHEALSSVLAGAEVDVLSVHNRTLGVGEGVLRLDNFTVEELHNGKKNEEKI